MDENLTNHQEILETQISEIQQAQTQSEGNPLTHAVSPAPSAKSTGRGWKIATAMMGVLALAGIAFGVYGVLNMGSADKLQKQLNNNGLGITNGQLEIIDQTLIPEILATDTTHAEVRALIDDVRTEVEKVVTYGVQRVYDDGLLVAQEGIKTLVWTDIAYGLKIDSRDFGVPEITLAFQSAIASSMASHGFTLQPDFSGLAYSDGYYLNTDGSIACLYASSDDFYCTNTSWVTLTDAELSSIDELSEAYYEVTGSYPMFINPVHDEDIVDSPVSPYQTFVTACTNAACLFYRTSPDAKWQFFTGTQAELSCSDYDSEDLKNAYSGSVCYDESTGALSTVQP